MAQTGVYSLVWEFAAHKEDVLDICVCGSVGIATSSSDHTVRFWCPDPESEHRYILKISLAGYPGFVRPLAWMPPCDGFPEGAVALGGTDNVVLWDLRTGTQVIWDVRTRKVSETIKDQQVSGLVIDGNGDIVLSYTDGSIRCWWKGHLVESWVAHKVAVHAVMKLTSGELITGSSDSTLKLWRGGTCLHTFVGHTDTVRGLAVMPGLGVLSASHDCSIKLWALTGELLKEMTSHTSPVYAVDAHSSGLVASGSEDRFLKIWRDGICVQSFEHPGCVWDAKFLENGDIVTACSDGIVRIWTSHSNHFDEIPGLKAPNIPPLYVKNIFTADGEIILVGISLAVQFNELTRFLQRNQEIGLPIHVGATNKLCYEDASSILIQLKEYKEKGLLTIIANEKFIAGYAALHPLKAAEKELEGQLYKKKGRIDKNNIWTAFNRARKSFVIARDEILQDAYAVEDMSEYWP